MIECCNREIGASRLMLGAQLWRAFDDQVGQAIKAKPARMGCLSAIAKVFNAGSASHVVQDAVCGVLEAPSASIGSRRFLCELFTLPDP